MTPQRQLIEKIGRQEVAEAVGVDPAAVREALRRDLLPAKWFLQVSRLAEKMNLECDPALFNFAKPTVESSMQ
ncbi:MAG: hypothetical protein AAF360_07235 [Pseudomonadota bacterium]